jgi:hypothetical protein
MSAMGLETWLKYGNRAGIEQFVSALSLFFGKELHCYNRNQEIYYAKAMKKGLNQHRIKIPAAFNRFPRDRLQFRKIKHSQMIKEKHARKNYKYQCDSIKAW